MARTVPSRKSLRPPGPRRLLAMGAAALALTSGAVLPAQGAAADDAKGGEKVLTVAVSQSVDSLSPFLAQRLISTSVHRLMYEYLTNYDAKDGHAIPGLATAWKTSPDKLTWTYTIRGIRSGPTGSG